MLPVGDEIRTLAFDLAASRGVAAAIAYCEAQIVDAAYLGLRSAVSLWDQVAGLLEDFPPPDVDATGTNSSAA